MSTSACSAPPTDCWRASAPTGSADDGVEAEVVDVCTLKPFDTATILASVAGTGRCVIVRQERVIGRTKPESAELEGVAKPPTAHIARAETEGAHGEEIEIYRRSTPYGTVREHDCTSSRSAPSGPAST